MRSTLLLAACMAFVASSVSAVEVQCAKHDQMVKLLSKKYTENPVAMGTVNSERYMQLFVSSKGTWTVLITKTDGQACIAAAGENWEKISITLAGPEA